MKKATNKQKQLAKIILQNPSTEVGEAMREVGYSENTRPHDITNTDSWKELMNQYLPDADILQAHQEGLKATKVVSAIIMGKDADSKTNDFIDVPDHPTRLKAVELAYKVKSKFQPTTLIQNNFGIHAKKELEEFE